MAPRNIVLWSNNLVFVSCKINGGGGCLLIRIFNECSAFMFSWGKNNSVIITSLVMSPFSIGRDFRVSKDQKS